MTTSGKSLFNIKESAEYLGLTLFKMRQLMRSGDLPTVSLGARYYVKRSDLKRFKNGALVAA